MKLKQEREIGKQLVAYREKAGLTQQKIGDLTGLTSDQIGLLERGQRNWTLGTLIRVTNALDVNLTTLFQAFEQNDEQTNELLQKIERNPKKETLIKAFNEILDTYDD
ncbi:MAG: helix-turn-helix domain-containing protein [Tetragenococcus koreensis]|uniref:helix-turn-helix domain-containing protein n=1 Tax=Tetragenococcus halophilus TaxID=51669 RepID=UPI00077C1C46|nr:helix-turn-helix transcriptional regulator [Tetragenococcus halophilus]MDN6140149.1 helix-turn-helix domain-containing protein [Tetragenococcus koreensis]MCO8289174.1 helix-turn-helix transcriptional regulator [Tetragenococcus halophilus]MDN6146699.1 helix-turn-helix domain-containing protein [Tetragenococcus koreensis]MDN6497406.1 helix-turn-helix domain-containing protein [Tetragenococcus koreensis]MDN6502334.1 helix-turn-helix domain-containing protein [Tetragenococcus koreensis]